MPAEKELFKLLKEAVPDEEFVDLVWKGAKIAEEDVLENSLRFSNRNITAS